MPNCNAPITANKPRTHSHLHNGNEFMALTITTVPGAASVAAAILYLLGMTLQIRGVTRKQNISMSALAAVTVPAVLLHAVAVYLQINTQAGVYLGFYTAGSLVSLIIVLVVFITALRLPVQNLLMLVLPISLIGVLTAALGETSFSPRAHLSGPLVTHILISLSAYSLLFMAACQSVVVAFQEQMLRRHGNISLLRLLPPLESMEKLLFSLLWIGIVALSLAIITGFAFMENMFDQRVVHHTVLAIASWVVYAVLLAGRQIFGWRSTTATYWVLIAFSLLVLGYFGSKFVLEVLLQN